MRKVCLVTPPSVDAAPKHQALVDAAWRVEQTARSGLSERERDTLGLLVAGASGAQIAASLGLSRSTIKGYLHEIYAKTGLAGREAVVRCAFELPVFDAPAAVESVAAEGTLLRLLGGGRT